MTNKHVLQIIAGCLSFFSFFGAWMTNIYYDVFTPTEIMNLNTDGMPLRIIFLGLPIIGVYNIYVGYIKKYNPIATIGNMAICGYLLLMVTSKVTGHEIANGYGTGYYLAIISLIVSVYSFVIIRKEIQKKEQEKSETM